MYPFADMSSVQLSFNLAARFEQQGDVFVGCFPDIDVFSQGHSLDEARQNLIEAAQLFLESCFERNVLNEVLKSCGFRPGHGSTTTQPGTEHLTVPFELLTNHGSPALAG